MKLSILLAGVALTVAPLAAQQGAPITAKTGRGTHRDRRHGHFFALPEAEYQALAAKLAAMPAFVTMKKKPNDAGPDTLRRQLYLWRQEPHVGAGWKRPRAATRCMPDLNANGDLSDDPPMKMTYLADGKYSHASKRPLGLAPKHIRCE
jgi:hypothetical protein